MTKDIFEQLKIVHEGEIKCYSADGQFAVQVKDGVANVIPMTGCFMGGENITLEEINKWNKSFGIH